METDSNHRGFDCTTYAGSLCISSLDPRKMGSSEDVASAAGTTACSVFDSETKKAVELDKADPKFAKEFFKSNKTGYFLMWSSDHLVVVADGQVHEFASSKGGYCGGTDVAEWLKPYNKMKLTVRKLNSRPPRVA